ncbi:hypothetical protein SAMN02745857_02640 [Andreprevotia lacus DSM 23236]|jgi:hypothetical protein|uniref:Lipoprotein n=1 Tax=Andreprevotia lacus DSM 23236 TaxID=1121001 RepID=A0A1W1XSD2_9NEIS|nr:hypothetical protein [Andreprevotia lacus]SMC26879.1 hypothetical protein SAMN02745857_02640 [Andreprevotia lacus DSM 23236]
MTLIFFRPLFKRTALLALIGALAACGTPAPTGKPAVIIATPTPVPSGPTPVPRPSPEAQPPSATINGRSANAVLDDIVRYRTGRGMTLKVRTGNRVEFSMQVQKVKVPTEARMRYQLTTVNGALQLSARVFQVLNPGTSREQINEITNDVAGQLEHELSGYAQSERH